jgi:hypothetical protein
MGCGCSQNPAAEVWDYVHTNTRGEQTTYPSQYEAQAAVLRDGGNWIKVPRT